MNEKKIRKELEKTHKEIRKLREDLRDRMLEYYECNKRIDDILKNLQEVCEEKR